VWGGLDCNSRDAQPNHGGFIKIKHIPNLQWEKQGAPFLVVTPTMKQALDESIHIPLNRSVGWWKKYRGLLVGGEMALTDENFLEGIREKITELRIIDSLIKSGMTDHATDSRICSSSSAWERGLVNARAWQRRKVDMMGWRDEGRMLMLDRLKQECALVYELIDYYISRGRGETNPRIDWVGNNDFEKECKDLLLSEFKVSGFRGREYSLKEIGDEEEKKYFTKINIGTGLKRDLEKEEEEVSKGLEEEFTKALEYQQQQQRKQDPSADVSSASSRAGGGLLKIKSKKRNKYKQTRNKRKLQQTKHKRKPKKARDKNKLKKKKTQNKNR
jgi:hypothetical protein